MKTIDLLCSSCTHKRICMHKQECTMFVKDANEFILQYHSDVKDYAGLQLTCVYYRPDATAEWNEV